LDYDFPTPLLGSTTIDDVKTGGLGDLVNPVYETFVGVETVEIGGHFLPCLLENVLSVLDIESKP
jgi:hypothetical protein